MTSKSRPSICAPVAQLRRATSPKVGPGSHSTEVRAPDEKRGVRRNVRGFIRKAVLERLRKWTSPSGRPPRHAVVDTKPRSRRSVCRSPEKMSHLAHSQLPGCFLHFGLMLHERDANGRVRTVLAQYSGVRLLSSAVREGVERRSHWRSLSMAPLPELAAGDPGG